MSKISAQDMADDHSSRMANTDNPKDYALSGKIMLSAIVILFFVVVLMVSLYLYAKWRLLRERRRQLLRRRRSRLNNPRRAHVVFYVDNNNPTTLSVPDPANRGLEPAVLGSLPVFVYSTKTRPEGLECAVCLSEFEENEKGRILPKCNHSFHIECIDMWFHSHSTCPICRAAVEPFIESENNRINLVVEPVTASSSGLCSACHHEEEGSSSTAPLASRRKGLDLTGIRIEVPGGSELEGGELPIISPASHGYKSPGSRLLSLKRILSMGRKTPTGSGSSPVGAAGTSCSTAGDELNIESELSRVVLTSR